MGVGGGDRVEWLWGCFMKGKINFPFGIPGMELRPLGWTYRERISADYHESS